MNFKQLAIHAAKKAGRELLNCSKDHELKGKYDLKAKADLVSEQVIVDSIKKSFPDHDIYSEEMGDGRNGSEYLWIIDPVDGTINFTKGMDEYCISIALEYRGELILGVIYQPTSKRLCVGEKGKGTFINGKRARVSRIKNLADMTVSTDNPYDERLRKKNNKLVCKIGDKVRQTRIFGCATLIATYIAQGEIDLYFYSDFDYWDFAASALIIKEAGGKVTDLKGDQINIDSKNILASNGIDHDQLLTEF